MIESCPVCHNKYKYQDDNYCRKCGAITPNLNQCKKCDAEVDYDDLFCHECGSETLLYDMTAR